MTTTIIIRLIVVLGLSSFMPFTAVSFFRFRLRQKKDDFQRIVEILELQHDSGGNAPPVNADTVYYPRGFILPVVFVTVLCLAGFTHLFFGDELLTPVHRNLLLGGTSPLSGMEPEAAAERLSLLVLVLAFTSAYLWSCQNVFRRLVTGDLGPGTYYSAGLRMTFAPLLALMISWLPGADTFGRDALPVMAFLIGIFPERGLHYLKQRIRIFSGDKSARADELPCDMIEGVDVFHKLRLAEVGIDNAQNLAEANLIDLLLRTPYRAGQLIDWIAQAKLYLLFKQDIEKLRRVGVRSAFELTDAGGDIELLKELAEAAEVSPVLLEVGRRSLTADRQLDRLRDYRNLLAVARTGGRGM